ncbi:aspartate and glycine-rich protein-like [Helianthus annuus]|uniref:aspartate and glycine-rich protein-like n=1 Tax=Helianthus annuus TaxID=4232 RepID=UPI000B8F6E78|nr:aspartate and glycine-rich protein-like [Helianthus annuus]
MIGGVVHRNGSLDGVKNGAIDGATVGNGGTNGKGDGNVGGTEIGGCLDDPSPGHGGGGVVHRNGSLDGVKNGAVDGAIVGNGGTNGKGDGNVGGTEIGGWLDDPSPGRGGGMS